jgi:uncharacterized protein YjdB
LTCVVIPDSVKSIGTDAFKCCSYVGVECTKDGYVQQYFTDNKKTISSSDIEFKTFVKQLSVSSKTLTIFKDKTARISVSVSPSNATDSTVAWSSSNENVATVENGKVTAKGKGTAIITCATKDGSNLTASCKVTVRQAVTGIKLSKSKATILKGKTCSIKATVAPSDAYNKNVTWTSSNKKVATVSSSGKVTAIAAGTANITCKAKDGSGVKVVCKVTVKQLVTKIKLNKTKATVLKGKTLVLKATVSPTKASNKKVSWKSSNTKIATVSASGKVTAKKNGTVTITCTAKDGSKKTAKCKITVKQPVTKIKLNKTKATIKKGKTVVLKATIAPKNAASKKVTWTSSNKKVATVTKTGKVVAKKKGTTVITCKASDGSGKKVTCKITVK